MNLSKGLLIILIITTSIFWSCNSDFLFELKEKKSFITFKSNFGSGEYNIALDAVEFDSVYYIVGATGKNEKDKGAFIAKIDFYDGNFQNFVKVEGDFTGGNSENLQSIIRSNFNKFQAIGFSHHINSGEGKIFRVTFNDELKELEASYENGTNWEAGYSISENEKGNILIAGSWDVKFGGLYDLNTEIDTITGFGLTGEAYDGTFANENYAILVGYHHPKIDNQVDFSKNNGYLANYFLHPNPGRSFHNAQANIIIEDYENATFNGVAQIEIDDSFIAVGHVWNTPNDRQIFLHRFDFGLNPIPAGRKPSLLKGLGQNDVVRDIIAVDDGVVMVGEINFEESNNANLLLMKTNFNGQFIWKKYHDFDGNNEFGWSIIETSDGGFLLTGQSFDANNDQENSLLILKTDAEGCIEGFPCTEF